LHRKLRPNAEGTGCGGYPGILNILFTKIPVPGDDTLVHNEGRDKIVNNGGSKIRFSNEPKNTGTTVGGASGGSSIEAGNNNMTVKAIVTFYGAKDNCPPGGDIAYPSKRHPVAGGTGTAADPATFASAKQALP
jgi:hypothetical protein